MTNGLINGNKVFTSGADQADFIWLAARTDPDAPKHKGISIFLCPPRSRISCTPIVTVGNVATTASYYDTFVCPPWRWSGGQRRLASITGQLNHERVGLAAVSALASAAVDETAEWAIDDGVADVGRVQADLARTYALLQAQKLLNWRMTAAVADDTLGPADSSAVKVFGTESTLEIYRRLLGIVGAAGYSDPSTPGRPSAGSWRGPGDSLRSTPSAEG